MAVRNSSLLKTMLSFPFAPQTFKSWRMRVFFYMCVCVCIVSVS